MIGYIFETTCLKNGKKFIGKRLSVSFDPREIGSNDALNADVAKYGYNSFVCKMLMPYETEKALNAAETWYIENSTDDLYNKSNTVKSDVVEEEKPRRTRKKKAN